MPVVQKIEQDCEGVPQEMLNISLYSDINDVYNAVVEFIKDYNQNK
jgi:flagellar capping protein FliD